MNRIVHTLLILAFLFTWTLPEPAPARAASLPPSPRAALPAASILVYSADDTQANDGVCTLREAIINANADDQSGSTDCASGSGEDEIGFSLDYPATIVLGSPLPAITGTLTIQGPGAEQLSISGNNAVQIMSVKAGASLTLQGLALVDGAGDNGGAIANAGSLVVSQAAFVGNTSMASSGAIYNLWGTLAVTGSTFQDNSAFSAGGAIGNYGGAATVTNSTFAGNNGGFWGGGAIYSIAFSAQRGPGSSDWASNEVHAHSLYPASPRAATLTVNASTFSGNSASNGGGAIGNGANGEIGGEVTLRNSVLAGNLAGGASVNCYNEGGALTEGGYNLEDANTCGFSGTSLINTDPRLLPLDDNGGSTQTLGLHYSSPAINHIPSGANGCGDTLAFDQRGVTRPAGAGCDAGAYESDQQPGPAFTVNQAGDESGLCGQSFCTLRQAIFTAQLYPAATAHTVDFNLAYPAEIQLGSQLPAITGTLIIQGPGADRLNVSGGYGTKILAVEAGASLTVERLTLGGGAALNGGAIVNAGSLAVSQAAFVANAAAASGGAIYNSGGTLEANACLFISNQAGTGGGAISNFGGVATVTNSTFVSNFSQGAWGGGAIFSRDFVSQRGPELSDSTFSGANPDARIPSAPWAAELVVDASTFWNNTAPAGGGAIGNGGNGMPGGQLILRNSALAGSLVGGASVSCYNEGGTLTDGGYNLEDANTCGFSGTSLTEADPKFQPLDDNGGGIRSVALHHSSPAINLIPSGANGCGDTLLFDQRGAARPAGAGCDAGAFEYSTRVYLPILSRPH